MTGGETSKNRKCWAWRWPQLALLLAFVAATSRADQSPPIPAKELVRKAVQNELRSAQTEGINHMYRSRKETPRGSQTRLYCETRDAMVGMTIANNDQPLTPEQVKAEEARLDSYIHNPDELRKKHQQEQEDADRVMRIVRALPDAFLYEYDGTEPGTATVGKQGDELARLRFRPNPHYEPPSRVEQVLSGMQGVLLIDTNAYRIAKIDGTLAKEVAFGWGILGHLDKGGHFLVEQSDIGEGSWDTRRMSLAFTGKILLFKHLDIRSTEVTSDYRPVPRDLTFAQGVEMLKKHLQELAENQPGIKNQK